MKKIISLLIISLLLNSCNHADEYVNSTVSQENRTEIKIQEKGEKNHTSSKVLNGSYHKEDLDINKLKEIIWQELKDFKTFKVYMKTKKFNIWIDQMDDGSYRYASWSKSKTIDEKPDIILKNGSVTYEGSARNHWYTFKNADVKYICDINVLGKLKDDAFLIVQRGETTILNESAKLISPFTKFIPKKNVVYFLESIYSEQSNNLSYFYDKYIFTENIKNRMYLLMKTDSLDELHSIYEYPGIYESHLYDNGGKNAWHYVSIKKMKDGNGLMWENKAGVSWSLWPTLNPLVFEVANDCPYFDLYQSVVFEVDSKNNILGVSANNEFYKLEEKIDEQSDKQLSHNLLNEEIRNFLKKSGYTSFEDIIQFVSGMNGGIKRNQYSFWVYTPKLFDWVSNIVNDDDDKSYQKYFTYFSSDLKDLCKAYHHLQEKGIDEESEKYLSIINENEDGIDYLTLSYGEEWVSDDFNIGYRGAYNQKARIMGFWLRRHINGNSKIIFDLLKQIIDKYEPNWSVDEWIIDDFDPYNSYHEPEGCSG